MRQHVTDYIRMASGAYRRYEQGVDENPKEFFDLGNAIPDWDVVAQSFGAYKSDQQGYLTSESSPNFAARVFQKQGTNEIVISFRGTDDFEEDLSDNLGFLFTPMLQQARDAEALVQAVINEFPGVVTDRPFDPVGFSGSFLDILGLEEAKNLHAIDLLALMEVRHFSNTGNNKLGDLFDRLPTIAGGTIDNSIAGPFNEAGVPDFTVLLRALAYDDAFYQNFHDAFDKLTKGGVVDELDQSAIEAVVTLGFQIARDKVNDALQNNNLAGLAEGIFGDDANAVFVNLNDIDPGPPIGVAGLDSWLSDEVIRFVTPTETVVASDAFDGLVFQTNGAVAKGGAYTGYN